MWFLKNVFNRKKTKSTKEILKELVPGDMVHIKFKSLGEIGIVSKNELAAARLNGVEQSIDEIKGTITFNRVSDPPLSLRIVEILTFNSPAMPGLARRITFLEDEIHTVRKIDG